MNTLIAKPVYAVCIGNLNLIDRFVIPYIGLASGFSDRVIGNVGVPGLLTGDNGFANVQYQAFFTPAEPGKVIWSTGTLFEFPTNTENLGSDKWSAGVGALALSMPGNRVVGGQPDNSARSW